MCGIVGYFTADSSKNQDALKKIMKRMLLASQVRGRDATGFACLNGKGEVEYCKDGVKASEFVEREEFKTLKMPNIFIGHTRHGTHGSPKDNKNNHPIYSKRSKMALTHNGVIYNSTGVINKHDLECDGEVDSEIILRMIEKEMYGEKKSKVSDIEKFIQVALEKINGSMTFALIGEAFGDKLILVRSGNPLSIAYCKELDTIFYASTSEILKTGFSQTYVMFDYIRFEKPLFKLFVQEMEENTMVAITHDKGTYKIQEMAIETKEEEMIIREPIDESDLFDRPPSNCHSKQEEEFYNQQGPKLGWIWNPKRFRWEPKGNG